MRTLAAGSKRLLNPACGFTLLELLVVVALIAVATAGVSLSLRDSADSALERDAERLAALLETGRAQARANGAPVVWRVMPQGAASDFVFEGLPPPGLPRQWLAASTRAASGASVTLGPEPLIEPRAIALSSANRPERQVWVVTDGLRPFKVQNNPELARP
ncbi:prepilin-type N-terminal cleavage/methylation domain-containing protein [Limnohabitans sp. G3-2]|uniref:prepilin-type N-terminal cleavage/methylation domain-containing protein n=1 Tax=Limnohabitans sp. G3-2 TaxID=1100711 RepID=UPI000C1EE091|nr:prepilin-type N-terminal cleavage/methylation domain-containing protein [Limnohabitans sp. G3-2]PIT75810.1 type II secretion system protein GspH [Limnohabitans sp. G3-2]